MHNENNLTTCYITKYALTEGIIEVKAEIIGNMIKAYGAYTSHYHKPYWFLTKEEAIKMAEEMRNKKIESLEKSIKKLRNLQIKIKTIEHSTHFRED